MSDDRTRRGPQDRSRINTSEDYEIRYWTETLGVWARRAQTPGLATRNSVEKARKALGK